MSVYFIRPIGMKGPVKIGCAGSPRARKLQLESWSPFDLEIAAELHGGHRLERRFHHLFYQQHRRLEWFEWSPELEAVIKAVRAGTFDLDLLPPDRGPIKGMAERLAAYDDEAWEYFDLFQRYYSRDGVRRHRRKGVSLPQPCDFIKRSAVTRQRLIATARDAFVIEDQTTFTGETTAPANARAAQAPDPTLPGHPLHVRPRGHAGRIAAGRLSPLPGPRRQVCLDRHVGGGTI